MSEQHDDDIFELDLYVRRPTEKDLEGVEWREGDSTPQAKLTVRDAEVMDMAPDMGTGIMVSAKRHSTNDGDLIGRLEEFVLSMKCGIYPSERSLQWLADGLEQWYLKPGQRLETCLGLVTGGRSGNKLKEANRESVVGHLLHIMSNLHFGFGLPLGFEESGGSYNDQTAAYVASSMSEYPHEWYRGSYEFPPLQQRTLLDYWKAAPWTRSEGQRELVKRVFNTTAERQAWIDKIHRQHWQHIKKLNQYL